jgi:hypothetical protein
MEAVTHHSDHCQTGIYHATPVIPQDWGLFLLQMHYGVTAAPLGLAWGGVFRLCSHEQLPQQA